MMRLLLFLSVAQIKFFSGCTRSDKDILEKTLKKLNAVEQLEYKAVLRQRDLNFLTIDTAVCYFDFSSTDSLLGPGFHFTGNRFEEIFNGKSAFLVAHSRGQILEFEHPTEDNLNISILRLASVLSIKKLIPEFLKDTTINLSRQKDTLINGEESYSFHFLLQNPCKLGEILRASRFITEFKLFISKKNYLPVEFNCSFADDKGTLMAGFSGINTKASRPDSIWSIARFPKDYARMPFEDPEGKDKPRISNKHGEKAPDWKLPLVSGDSVRLSDLKGNLVLLEFWFPNCKGCVESIPDLNNFQETYTNKGLKIYGIEFTRFEKERLTDYISKHGIHYPTLFAGRQVSRWYGVNIAPSFFLISKNGAIVYSSVGFNKSELRKAIESNI